LVGGCASRVGLYVEFVVWGMGWAEVVVVAATAASPVGELLVAYPLGLALGLDPLVSLVVSVLSNLVPVPLLLRFLWFLRRRFGRFFGWVERRGGFYSSYARWGLPVFFLLTPLAGVYATTLVMRLFGFSGFVVFFVQAGSLAAWGAVLYLATLGVFSA